VGLYRGLGRANAAARLKGGGWPQNLEVRWVEVRQHPVGPPRAPWAGDRGDEVFGIGKDSGRRSDRRMSGAKDSHRQAPQGLGGLHRTTGPMVFPKASAGGGGARTGPGGDPVRGVWVRLLQTVAHARW